MAKKRTNPFDDTLGRKTTPPAGQDPAGAMDPFAMAGLEMKEVAPLLAGLTDQEGMMLFTMLGHLAESGITPEIYSAFYKAYQHLRPAMMVEPARTTRKTRRKDASAQQPLPEQATLVLKIQMKGVVKPPMWREVEISADATFLDLHDVIQCVTGLENCHLWQFNESAYDDTVQIGILSTGDFHPGLDDITDDAATTRLSAYLNCVGAKLDYIYDFGDDWVFTVAVKKVLDKKSDHPVCTGCKSELNAMEDMGGPWSYERIRIDFTDWSTYTRKRKGEIADEFGFDSAKAFYDFLTDKLFDMKAVNERLSRITRR